MSFAEAQSCWLSNDGAAPAAGENVPCYPDLVGALREFVDAFAGAHPDQETIKALTQDLQSWKRNLTLFAVAEGQQPFGRQHTLPGRGQIMTPTFRVTEADSENVRGTVIFGRFFLGINGAAHGGAIQLLFDEVLGRLASLGARGREQHISTQTFVSSRRSRYNSMFEVGSLEMRAESRLYTEKYGMTASSARERRLCSSICGRVNHKVSLFTITGLNPAGRQTMRTNRKHIGAFLILIW